LDHVERVFRFALRLSGDHHTAEDITQEALLRAWKHKEELRHERALRTWLFRIAANVWRDRLRRSQHAAAQAEPLDRELADRVLAPDDAAAVRDDVRRAVAAMDSLPPRQREVLYLHACEQLTHEEIAQVLGITLENVKASLSLARKKLRGLWQQRLDGHVSK
jgi:RNA polymerase sigma-70 factor (ECF subfamily)